jgi:hypothetical protein
MVIGRPKYVTGKLTCEPSKCYRTSSRLTCEQWIGTTLLLLVLIFSPVAIPKRCMVSMVMSTSAFVGLMNTVVAVA